MEGDGIVLVVAGGDRELLRDLGLGRAEDDPGLPLALGLGLLAHGVGQGGGDDDVADADRLAGDAPGVGVLVEGDLEGVGDLLPVLEEVGELVLADDVAEARLGDEGDGGRVVLDLEDGLLGVPDRPVDDRVHVGRDGVLGQRFLGLELRHPDALVDVGDHAVHDRDDQEGAGAFQAAVLAHPQDDGPLPLVGDPDRAEDEERQDEDDDERNGADDLEAGEEPVGARAGS